MANKAILTAAQLRRAVQGDLDRLIEGTAEALNQARPGAIISDSEEVVRDLMARFRQVVFEKAVQLKADAAAKAAFSPSGRRGGGKDSP